MSAQGAEVRQESLFVALGGESMHLRRIRAGEGGPPLLMVHGAIANARTFYSEKGKGLGPWLARQGYDVFVLDLRGRGLSTPPLGRNTRHGQTESICEDIPVAIAEIQRLRGFDAPLGLVAHSWGGVLLSAALARRPDLAAQVRTSVYLASKRSISVWNWRRFLEIDVFWNLAATMATWVYGYLPAGKLGIGADSESKKSLRQSQQWVRPAHWVDEDDGFDYTAALAQGGLPATLYLVGTDDPVRGHPVDVARFVAESGPHDHVIRHLGCSHGMMRDYGHLDMLTHPEAEREVFPLVLDWLTTRLPVR